MKLDPFYPIVDTLDWIKRLAPCGIRLIQLRNKSLQGARLTREIAEAAAFCKAQAITLVVNDFWQEAIAAGAPFVHLGQGDLDGADVKALQKRGIRLGISTHDDAELDRALSFAPDYVALGPIWPTLLKIMPFAPQGVAKLTTWKQKIGEIPLVAIGGITLERAQGCFAAGADSVALVNDVTGAADPEARARSWVAATRGWVA
ncbi:MAG: thiamine phosphate synthase [Hyphomicrobiales bacterium]|nr:thiamine phosphate synthase [Hyphomicrobiales bacterium]